MRRMAVDLGCSGSRVDFRPRRLLGKTETRGEFRYPEFH